MWYAVCIVGGAIAGAFATVKLSTRVEVAIRSLETRINGVVTRFEAVVTKLERAVAELRK